jgi:hypothetical protein
VVEDPAIKELIFKAKGFGMEKPSGEPVVVMEYRGRTSEGNAIIHPRMVYSDRTEYEKLFTEEVRAGFNGRTLVHEKGSNRFDCLTSIVDDASEEKKGKWVVVGKTGKDFLEKEFAKKEELDKELPAILEAVEEYALVHQYGTSDYAILEAHKTMKIGLVTEGIQTYENLKQPSEKLKQVPEGDFTEPEILDLSEEELK